jgi:hypothetical protein
VCSRPDRKARWAVRQLPTWLPGIRLRTSEAAVYGTLVLCTSVAQSRLPVRRRIASGEALAHSQRSTPTPATYASMISSGSGPVTYRPAGNDRRSIGSGTCRALGPWHHQHFGAIGKINHAEGLDGMHELRHQRQRKLAVPRPLYPRPTLARTACGTADAEVHTVAPVTSAPPVPVGVEVVPGNWGDLSSSRCRSTVEAILIRRLPAVPPPASPGKLPHNPAGPVHGGGCADYRGARSHGISGARGMLSGSNSVARAWSNRALSRLSVAARSAALN